VCGEGLRKGIVAEADALKKEAIRKSKINLSPFLSKKSWGI